MITCLIMSRSCGFSVGVFFLIAGSFASDISSNIWVMDRNFGKHPNTSELLWEKDGISLHQCCYLCDWDRSCKSFFYHPSLMKCLASQSYKRGLPAGQATHQGWKYYTKPQCDGDYVYNKTLGLCYKLHTERMNYSDAMAACETEGAKLLIISNEAEYQHFLNITPYRATYAWIGLQKGNAKGEWKWWNGRIASHIPVYTKDVYPEDTLCGNFGGEGYRVYFCSFRRNFWCQKYI